MANKKTTDTFAFHQHCVPVLLILLAISLSTPDQIDMVYKYIGLLN